MKWYHWSVEYFEDLRNVNHCEFVVMKHESTSRRSTNSKRNYARGRSLSGSGRRGSIGRYERWVC